MKKITILALVLVLCLGAIGVGYAKWTDEIKIDGTVKTGSVDLCIQTVNPYSGSWFYKDLTTNELKSFPSEQSDPNLYYVGGSWAEYGGADDTVKVTFDNIFPTCKFFSADAKFYYCGTVPAVVTYTCEYDAVMTQILGTEGVTWQFYVQYKRGTDAWKDLVWGETEIYKGDLVMLWIKLKLPQDNSLMNLTGTFTCKLNVEQWASC